VLPYAKAEFRDNEQSYLEYYDEVEICSASAQAHPKAAIQIRNRIMVDRSDMVICYVQHKSGGSYKTIQYAKKQGKRIINLAKER
jgi:predicted Rossmann fold nucleotide-binding protein DprA/Smf involved in DNA uptake